MQNFVAGVQKLIGVLPTSFVCGDQATLTLGLITESEKLNNLAKGNPILLGALARSSQLQANGQGLKSHNVAYSPLPDGTYVVYDPWAGRTFLADTQAGVETYITKALEQDRTNISFNWAQRGNSIATPPVMRANGSAEEYLVKDAPSFVADWTRALKAEQERLQDQTPYLPF